MAEEQSSLVLERTSFRRRRVRDAATLIPFFGVVLLCLPAMWETESRTAPAMVYVFTVWALLILVMAVIARRVKVLGADEGSDESPSSPRDR